MSNLQRRLARLDGGRNLAMARQLAGLTDDELDARIAAELPDPAAYLAMPRDERWRWAAELQKELHR